MSMLSFVLRKVGVHTVRAISVVAELVDVHATLGVGVMAADVPRDGGGRTLGVLLEGDGALDVGVTTNDCDCCGARVVSRALQGLEARLPLSSGPSRYSMPRLTGGLRQSHWRRAT